MESMGVHYEPAGELEVVGGYAIMDRLPVGDKMFVLGENPNAVQPFVTWQGYQDFPGYDWGHYFNKRFEAQNDLLRRFYKEKDSLSHKPKAAIER